jgi:hypothetical protein
MLTSIRKRTHENLERAKNLVEIYDRANGNPNLHDTDILRAAVVFLHASLEDCLRSIAYEKLPFATQSELNKTEQKVSLSKIAEYRGKTVDELIKDVIDEYLGRKTYNNPGEIKTALKALAIEIPDNVISDTESVMQRRHKIVHRADRSEKEGGEVGSITKIQSSQVSRWIGEVERFVDAVLTTFEQQRGDLP